MGRRLFASLVLAIALLGLMPVAVAGAQTAQLPSSEAQCKHGGWRGLTDGQGHPFRNQGQCINWRKRHPVSLRDVAGTFTGTQSFTFATNGCTFVHQIFDARYAGTAAVGTVALQLEGCVNDNITAYSGTFVLTTSGGTLSGTVSGQVLNGAMNFELDLNVTSGTGAFAGITGTLHVSIAWPGGGSITGSVTAP